MGTGHTRESRNAIFGSERFALAIRIYLRNDNFVFRVCISISELLVYWSQSLWIRIDRCSIMSMSCDAPCSDHCYIQRRRFICGPHMQGKYETYHQGAKLAEHQYNLGRKSNGKRTTQPVQVFLDQWWNQSWTGQGLQHLKHWRLQQRQRRGTRWTSSYEEGEGRGRVGGAKSINKVAADVVRKLVFVSNLFSSIYVF